MHIVSISARAQKAFIEIGLVSMSLQQERTMDSLLKIFDAELKSLEKDCASCECASPTHIYIEAT